MEYNRAFIIQSCHFNDNRTYDMYDQAMRAAKSQQYDVAFDCMKRVLPDIHGHNFDVHIGARSLELGDSDCDRGGGSWVVADELLRTTVAEWDSTNLSVHPDFHGVRATTENMAAILARKLSAMCADVEFTVTVRERWDIEARATA